MAKDPKAQLGKLGMVGTNSRRLAGAAEEVHRAVCKMDTRQLALARRSAPLLALLIVATWYGRCEGLASMKEFGVDEYMDWLDWLGDHIESPDSHPDVMALALARTAQHALAGKEDDPIAPRQKYAAQTLLDGAIQELELIAQERAQRQHEGAA